MTEWAERRQRFSQHLGDAAALIPGARMVTRNADNDYPFRQNSDFAYLTGFPEPDAVALILHAVTPQYILFVRPRDRSAETWTGKRFGVEGACEFFGADQAYPISELSQRLPQLLVGIERLAYRFGQNDHFDRIIFEALQQARTLTRRGGLTPEIFLDPSNIVHEMRLHKSPHELQTLRAAAAITAQGFDLAMRNTRVGMMEYELQADLEGTYRRLGAQDIAYPSIVAAGANATILHYNTNRERLADGDLVLIDSGCELDNYASDVTRTWPINGTFSAEQRALYEIVLAAQNAAFAELRIGRPFDAYHHAAVRVLTEGLCDLGLIHGSLDTLIETEQYKSFYMHRTGHWLGLDVHDAGKYTKDTTYRALEAGMVLTVEPGLYISPDLDVPEHFKGIGIRIEDDVHITADQPENLTAAIPKQVPELEAILQQEGR